MNERSEKNIFPFPSANSHFNKFIAVGSSYQKIPVQREVNNTW